MALVASCVPAKCDGPNGPITMDIPDCQVERNGTDSQNQTLRSNGGQRFEGIDGSEAIVGHDWQLRANPHDEMLVDQDDLKWLGCKSTEDELGPGLRVDLASKVLIDEESLTLAEVLKNTNPEGFWKPSPELEARRFRLSDIVDVECDILDGIMDGDKHPDLLSLRLSHVLRELNGHMLKHLEDKKVDWQQVRSALHRRGFLLRRASSCGIPVAEAEGRTPGRRYSASPRRNSSKSRNGSKDPGANDDLGLVVHDHPFLFPAMSLPSCIPQESPAQTQLEKESLIIDSTCERTSEMAMTQTPESLPMAQSTNASPSALSEQQKQDEPETKPRICSRVKCDWLA